MAPPAARCRGECKRTAADPVTDSPARKVRVGPNRVVLACDCCYAALEYVPELAGPQGALPEGVMHPTAATSAARLYRCRACAYDVRLLRDIRPAP